jgi:hypothetical protein
MMNSEDLAIFFKERVVFEKTENFKYSDTKIKLREPIRIKQ